MHSPHLYEYPTLMDLQAETAIASLFYCLNTPGRVHDFALARLHKVATQDQLGYLPHTRPYALKSHCSQDYLRATITFMAERQCSFHTQQLPPFPPPAPQRLRITLREVISKATFSKWGSNWANRGFVFLEQVVTEDGQRVRSEETLNPSQATRHHRKWYAALTEALCVDRGPQHKLRHDILELLAIVLRLEEDHQLHSRYLRSSANRTRTFEEMGFGTQLADPLHALRTACPPPDTWQDCIQRLEGPQGAILCNLATLYPSSIFNWPMNAQQRPGWLSEEALFAPPEQEQDSESDWLAFSDGSLKHSRSLAARAGGGVTFVRPPGISSSFRLLDARSSSSSEAGALLVALASTPLAADCEIRLDNQVVVQHGQQIIAGHHLSVRRRINQPCSNIWEGFRQLASTRTGRTKVTWVRGHADDPNNIEADRLAKEGADQPAQGPVVPAFGLRYKLFLGPCLVEGNPGQIIKRVHLRRSWTLWCRYSSGRFFKYIPLEVLEQWALKTGTMRTSWADCAQRAFVVKLWTDSLPTMARRARDRPDLYSNGNCKRCDTQAAEDVEHLWACAAAAETRTRIAQELGDALVALASALGWPEIETPGAWSASKFPWLLEMREGFPHRSQQIEQLRHGILPMRAAGVLASFNCAEHKLIKAWKGLQTRFIALLHGLWKERCEDTIAWERKAGITRGQKRQPRLPTPASAAASTTRCAICHEIRHTTLHCPQAQSALAVAGPDAAILWRTRAPDATPFSKILARAAQEQQQLAQQPASPASLQGDTPSNSQPLAG